MKMQEMWDMRHTRCAEALWQCENPWEILQNLSAVIIKIGETLPSSYRETEPHIWVHESVTVAKTAILLPPCIIGKNTEVRPGAWIRGSVIVGDTCVIGNSTELKNCILFDRVQVPHYTYVGDSILGYCAHMGGGAVTSNLKSDKSDVIIHGKDGDMATGMRKLGALVGDYAEIGCGTVLAPGSVVGKNSTVYPLMFVRGVIPSDSIYKTGNILVKKQKDGANG